MIKKPEKITITTVIILMIMMIGFVSICYQIVLKNVVVDKLGMKAGWIENTITSLEGRSIYSPEPVEIDWGQIYPFAEPGAYEQVSFETENTGKAESGSRIGRIYDQFEKYSTEWFMFTEYCELASKGFNKILGMNLNADVYGNLVFEQSDGRYAKECLYKKVDNEADNVISFAEYLEGEGIDYLYVTVPSPIAPDAELRLIEEGYREYSNRMADEFLEKLSDRRIPYIDLRERLYEENVSWTDVFAGTDHHWKPEYGLWGAGVIAEQINERNGFETDSEIFDINSYARDIREKVYMGSYGNVVTALNVEKDSMEVWSARFETDLTKTVPESGLEISGSFDEVMYDLTVWPSYNIWNHGITGVKTYHNNRSSMRGYKILCLTDSYSDVVTPFLASEYEDMAELDLRCFGGSLEAYIEEYQPDLVLTIYSAYDFNNGSGNGLYMFR